ncbi:MAG: hypothetical protein AAF719_05390 [Pseudomonadota bacterium]
MIDAVEPQSRERLAEYLEDGERLVWAQKGSGFRIGPVFRLIGSLFAVAAAFFLWWLIFSGVFDLGDAQNLYALLIFVVASLALPFAVYVNAVEIFAPYFTTYGVTNNRVLLAFKAPGGKLFIDLRPNDILHLGSAGSAKGKVFLLRKKGLSKASRKFSVAEKKQLPIAFRGVETPEAVAKIVKDTLGVAYAP